MDELCLSGGRANLTSTVEDAMSLLRGSDSQASSLSAFAWVGAFDGKADILEVGIVEAEGCLARRSSARLVMVSQLGWVG